MTKQTTTMQCPTMNRRTLTMNWDGLIANEEDDRFFETYDRLSSVVPLDLCSSGSDEEDNDFEDSRMSFVSAISTASIKSIRSIESIGGNRNFEPIGGNRNFEPIGGNRNSSSILASYDMWMSEPGDIRERRKRLLQGMGLSSTKGMLRLASSKIAGAISTKISAKPDDHQVASATKVDINEKKSSGKEEEEGEKQREEPKVKENNEPEVSPPQTAAAIVLVRSRSDGDIDSFSAKTKQRKEELIGPESKQRLTRTSSGVLVPRLGLCKYSADGSVRISPRRGKNASANNDALQSALSDGTFGSFFLIKNLDTGKEFIVKEYNEQGMWNKLSDVQTGKQLTMEEFEKSVGYSPVVKELMRRHNGRNGDDGKKMNNHSLFSKSFRNSKRKGAAFLKNIKGVATSVSGLKIVDKEHEQQESSSPQDPKAVPKNVSQWVKVRQHGKSCKEFTALHMSQEIQAHEGSIWTMRFSSDARFLASAGEDKVIHIWEVQECEIMSTKPDDFSSGGGTPIHPMSGGGNASDRPPLAEITPMLSERKRRGKHNKKKGIPDYVNLPETVFALSEKPVCTFMGHQEDVLDLSWSTSQLLLSSSMDKTVRLWDMETKSCLRNFAHNDYVTCIGFNPVDDNYFISGSLDAKVRIWSISNRKVVDWTDLHEMVTAASYTPDGQGAIIGSHQGICRYYDIDDGKLEHRTDVQMKKKGQAKMLPGFQSQPQLTKITGFQFSPSNPSEVLITSTDSRIRTYNETELIQKFRGFRNTGSQISASFSQDGKHVLTASEDSQVYIWKVEESKNPGPGKKRNKVTVQAHEHFPCKDVSVAIPWPGCIRDEPPLVEIHSKRHSKRLTAPIPQNQLDSDTNPTANASSRRHLPPLPKKISKEPENSTTNNYPKNDGLERLASCNDDDFSNSSRLDPGIGASDSFSSSSASISHNDSPSISASGASPSQSWGNQTTVQATAWGMVIVTASLEGEIRVYQNFGLPLKVSRQVF